MTAPSFAGLLHVLTLMLCWLQVWPHHPAGTCQGSTIVPPEVSAVAGRANKHGDFSALGAAI